MESSSMTALDAYDDEHPLKHERMKVLDSSSGSASTLWAKSAQNPVAEQVLFDVGQVEDRHRRLVRLQVRAHRAQRLRPGEVADDRHQQIPLLERLERPKAGFTPQIRAVLPGPVGRDLQIRVRRIPHHPAARRRALRVGEEWTGAEEVLIDVLDAGQVVGRELEAVLLDEHVAHGLQVFLVQRAIRLDLAVPVEEFLGRRRRVKTRRAFAREQPREELRAIGRELEERLVHQVLLQIAASDVGNEGDMRLERGDVREVLVGTDAQVHAAGLDDPRERRQDDLQRVFVRDEVVGPEVPAGLGEVVDQAPELLIAQVRRKLDAGRDERPARRRAERKRDRERNERDAATNHRGVLTPDAGRRPAPPQPRVSSRIGPR